MIGKRILVLAVVLLLLLGIPMVIQAETDSSTHKSVYIILVDKLSVHDISESSTPAISRLIEKGALGLASSRTLRSPSTMDSSLTIGAGNLARAYSHGLMAFNRDEVIPKHGEQTATQLYRNLTGIDPSPNALLMINLPEIVSGMSKENVNTLPGALGETLRKSQLKVCVLGNGDNGEEMLRSAVAIGMDARGLVPLGDVGSATYLSSATSFLSYESNYAYLAKQVVKYQSQADLMIVELSDLARLESADTPQIAIAEKEKQLRLRKIDSFVDQIGLGINPARDLLLVIAPSASQKQLMNKDSFSIVIAYGSGFEKGFLSSGSTRRDYVVANTDIAPTILKFFGLKNEAGTMIGQPMVSKLAGNRDTLQEARNLSVRTSTVNRLRAPLIKGYVVLQIAVILLSLLAIFYIKKLVPIFETLIVALVAVPLVLLPLGKIKLLGDAQYILLAILATVAVTFVSLWIGRGNGFKAFVGLSILTVLAINIDLLTGATMIQSSVLGYDPMSGARYYGIGNEYMGILIGSMVAISAAVYERFNRRWLLFGMGWVFLAQCYMIAGPSLGANSDGMLTAPAAFLITLALLANLRISPGLLLAFAGVILVTMLGFSYFDMHQPLELQSHIGRAANQIVANGWQEGLTIINRKLAMNFKLIRYTIWSWVFIVTLLVLALLVYRPIGAMGRLRKEHPYLVKGFAGIITGAVVALVVNDSGIVAASTICIYLVMPLLLLMLRLGEPGRAEKLP